MYSKTEYKRKVRKLGAGIKKRDEKLLRNKSDLQRLRQENKYQRRRIKELTAGRDGWKEKNRRKSKRIKGLEKREGRREKAFRHQYGTGIVELAVRLRQKCGCSYRGICKVIGVLNIFFSMGAQRAPCANTVRNWVTKTGLYHLKNTPLQPGAEEVCIIVDESVRLGKESLLMLLACPAENTLAAPLAYRDVGIAYLCAKESWTGEKIRAEIERTAGGMGVSVAYILSDEDSKLKKAAKLLGVPHVPDISHLLSTCLRRAFDGTDAYLAFIKLLGQYQQKTFRQPLNYLRPAKQRAKARFMNQGSLVDWGLGMLDNLDKLGKEEAAELKHLNSGLKKCRLVLEELKDCIGLCKKVGLLFKSGGLCGGTLRKAGLLMDGFTAPDGRRAKFLAGLRAYVSNYRALVGTGANLHACSDIIESLFGAYKNKVRNNHRAGISMLSLELPLYCMPEGKGLDVKQALEHCSVSALTQWKKSHSIEDQSLKRKKYFSKRT